MGQKIYPLRFRLCTTQIIFPFGSHNQKVILKVYMKRKNRVTAIEEDERIRIKSQ